MPPQHSIVREGGPHAVRAALVELALWAAMALVTLLAVQLLDEDVAAARGAGTPAAAAPLAPRPDLVAGR